MLAYTFTLIGDGECINWENRNLPSVKSYPPTSGVSTSLEDCLALAQTCIGVISVNHGNGGNRVGACYIHGSGTPPDCGTPLPNGFSYGSATSGATGPVDPSKSSNYGSGIWDCYSVNAGTFILKMISTKRVKNWIPNFVKIIMFFVSVS